VAEQRVGHCATTAGLPVAYAVAGHGPALLFEYGFLSHIEREWEPGPFRAHIDLPAQDFRVVRADKPGFGIAGPGPGPSLEVGVATLLAVADHLGLERFALRGDILGGSTAIAFAAAHPERLTRLVLYGAYACGEDIGGPPVRASIEALVRNHWGLGSRLLADLWMAGADQEAVDWFARLQRGTATADSAARVMDHCMGSDVRAAARAVRTPTLVVRRQEDRVVPAAAAARLAELIPGARLVEVPGRAHLAWVGDREALLEPMLAFLGVERRGRATGLTRREREVAALTPDSPEHQCRGRAPTADNPGYPPEICA
jgi:pimeloyl-ACP methyl ester carboxylesterase